MKQEARFATLIPEACPLASLERRQAIQAAQLPRELPPTVPPPPSSFRPEHQARIDRALAARGGRR